MKELEQKYNELKAQKQEIESQMKAIYDEAQNILIAECEKKYGLSKGCRIKVRNEVYFYDSLPKQYVRVFSSMSLGLCLSVRKIKKNGKPYTNTTTFFYVDSEDFEVIK